MSYIYLEKLRLGLRHPFCVSFGYLGLKEDCMVTSDGLEAHLVMHVYDAFFIGFGQHHSRPLLVLLLTSKEVLQKDMVYQFII